MADATSTARSAALEPAERVAERTTAVAPGGLLFGALRAVSLGHAVKTPLALSTAANAGM